MNSIESLREDIEKLQTHKNNGQGYITGFHRCKKEALKVIDNLEHLGKPEIPYNIAELIEEYEKDYKSSWEDIIEFVKETRGESEETEVKKQELIKNIEFLVRETSQQFPHEEMVELPDVLRIVNQLDEPEPENITLQDVTEKLWELPLHNRKFWLERLNNEFQEGYIVPLSLKTTDGEEQYLTYSGSYFASRRNKNLQQTFDTLEEIPEFYRDLAERVL